MLRKLGIAAGLMTAGMLALESSPALAQIEPATHELHGFVGYVFGDDLTDTPISGATPELDDDFTFGVRYVYNINEMLGFDASFSYNPNSATNLPTGDVDLDVMMLDLDAVWNFSPTAQFVPYIMGGVGYAFADLDNQIVGIANGQPVVINDDDGFTLNVGVGGKYFINELTQLRIEVRYRYIDKLVDTFDDSLNTFEATIGAGIRF